MERALILSDTHGATARALGVIKSLSKQKEINKIIHLGDGLEDINDIKSQINDIPVEYVKGNIDFDTKVRDKKIVDIGDKKFVLVHGHKYNVKQSLKDFIQITQTWVRHKQLSGVLFGHTHKSYKETIDNTLYFNPGACGDQPCTYGVIEVDGDQINSDIFEYSF